MASVPTHDNDRVATEFAKQAIQSELIDRVEEEILAYIKPRIRELAKGAVAAFAIKQINVQHESSPFDTIDNILITFVENVIVNRTKEITVKET